MSTLPNPESNAPEPLGTASPRPAVSEARKFLRDSTHAAHVRLNQHPLLVGITKPGYGLDSCQRVLVAYYHFYQAIETAIDRFLGEHDLAFSYDARRKLAWIKEDLLHFGIDPETSSKPPKALLAPIVLGDLGQLVGVLYTIEGSSLGGQVISRHLAANLGLTPARGARFFYGYGESTMDFWMQFEGFMSATLAPGKSLTSAGESANTTFELMEAVLDEYHSHHPADRFGASA